MALHWYEASAWSQADIDDGTDCQPGDVFGDSTTYRIFPRRLDSGEEVYELWVWSGPAERSGVLGVMGSDLRSQDRARRLAHYPTLEEAKSAAELVEEGPRPPVEETSPLLGGLHASYSPWKGGEREFIVNAATPCRRAVTVYGTELKSGDIRYRIELSEKKVYSPFVIPTADEARSIASALWLIADAMDRLTGRTT